MQPIILHQIVTNNYYNYINVMILNTIIKPNKILFTKEPTYKKVGIIIDGAK